MKTQNNFHSLDKTQKYLSQYLISRDMTFTNYQNYHILIFMDTYFHAPAIIGDFFPSIIKHNTNVCMNFMYMNFFRKLR